MKSYQIKYEDRVPEPDQHLLNQLKSVPDLTRSQISCSMCIGDRTSRSVWYAPPESEPMESWKCPLSASEMQNRDFGSCSWQRGRVLLEARECYPEFFSPSSIGITLMIRAYFQCMNVRGISITSSVSSAWSSRRVAGERYQWVPYMHSRNVSHSCTQSSYGQWNILTLATCLEVHIMMWSQRRDSGISKAICLGERSYAQSSLHGAMCSNVKVHSE